MKPAPKSLGTSKPKLISTERVTTEHNCIPRDLVSIGDEFLFGYNVQFGLKTEIGLSDVFSAYRFSDHQFHERHAGSDRRRAVSE